MILRFRSLSRLLLSFVALTFALNFSFGSRAEAQQAPSHQLSGLTGAKAYLRLAPDDLYEQPQTNTQEFSSLSQEEQDKVLIEHFFSRKYSPLNASVFRDVGIFALLASYPTYQFL